MPIAGNCAVTLGHSGRGARKPAMPAASAVEEMAHVQPHSRSTSDGLSARCLAGHGLCKRKVEAQGQRHCRGCGAERQPAGCLTQPVAVTAVSETRRNKDLVPRQVHRLGLSASLPAASKVVLWTRQLLPAAGLTAAPWAAAAVPSLASVPAHDAG